MYHRVPEPPAHKSERIESLINGSKDRTGERIRRGQLRQRSDLSRQHVTMARTPVPEVDASHIGSSSSGRMAPRTVCSYLFYVWRKKYIMGDWPTR